MKIRLIKDENVFKEGEILNVDAVYNDLYVVNTPGGSYGVSEANCEEVIEHNSQLYRKVDRPVREGDTVVIADAKGTFDSSRSGDIFEVDNMYILGKLSRKASSFNSGNDDENYTILEPIEQSGQPETLTERDLLANLAQEVAELKRQLTNAKTDIADLEDRVDENEKDVEEVMELAVDNQTEILGLDANVDEIIARMNDVSEAVVPVEVIEKVIAELRELEGHAEKLCGHYEDNGIKELAQFHDGKSHAFLDAQKLLKEALRNG